MERVKWTYDILEQIGFVKHKVVVGNAHNYIKGDFRINDAYPVFMYKDEKLPKIIYLDDLAGIYFEKTGEHLKFENPMKQELITAKDIADDVQQSFEIPNSYRKLLEDRINNLLQNKKLYALFDSGGQGMKDNGLLGVYTTKEEAEKVRGNSWYSIIEFDANKIYADGVQYSG
jgi:hypothetical protein